MSNTKDRIDHVALGVIVAFDPETGDPLHVHEEFSETAEGSACATSFTEDEVEHVRAEAVERHPRRRIDVVTAPPEAQGPQQSNLGDPGFTAYRVDPMKRQIRRLRPPDIGILQTEADDKAH